MTAILFQSGMRLTPARLNSLPKGEIARASRSGNVTLNTTGETGILRLDDVPVKAGRVYAIRAPRLRYDATTATDRGKFHLRINTAGVATTSSTVRARSEGDETDSLSIEYFHRPSTNETLSVLLSILKVTGTGTWAAMGSDEGGIDLVIEDQGEAATDTGVDV